MKIILIFAVIWMTATVAVGQDSLDVHYVREIPGERLLYLDDNYRVGTNVVLHSDYNEWYEYFDTTSVVIFDNRNPFRPRELWRGLECIGSGQISVEYNAFEITDVELRDSLIFVVQTHYNVFDVPGASLFSNLICYDWIHNDTLWIRQFYWRNDGGWQRPPQPEFTYPDGLVVQEDRLAVALGTNGFHIFDISDLRNPQPTYSYNGSAICLRALENMLALATYDSSLDVPGTFIKVIDWETPNAAIDSITLEQRYYFPEDLIASSGTRLFVNLEDSIGIWNLSEDRILEPMPSIEPDSVIYAFSITNDTLLISFNRGYEFWRVPFGEEPSFMGRNHHGERYHAIKTELYGDWIYRGSVNTHQFPGGILSLHHIGPVTIRNEDAASASSFLLHSPYPNPFNNRTMLNYELPLASEVNIGVRDMNGRLLHHESLQGDAGLNNIALDAANLPAGIYFVELETAGKVLRTKAVCVK